MQRTLMISTDPIDEPKLASERRMSRHMGAAVYFAGVVREMEGESAIAAIDYETFREMAEHQFEKIFQEIERRWPIESVRLVHRIGKVRINEPSLWVEVTAPHRGEAFEACQYLIEEMKRVVPIWKRPMA